MPITIYDASIPILQRMLRNLSVILDKAAAHASARKIDPAVLLSMRLAPDMFPLMRQVQTVTDFAKAIASRLAGREPPKWDDTEKTFEDLKLRIERALKLLSDVKSPGPRGRGNPGSHRFARRPSVHVQRRRLSLLLCAAELLFPCDHGLRHLAPCRH